MIFLHWYLQQLRLVRIQSVTTEVIISTVMHVTTYVDADPAKSTIVTNVDRRRKRTPNCVVIDLDAHAPWEHGVPRACQMACSTN